MAVIFILGGVKICVFSSPANNGKKEEDMDKAVRCRAFEKLGRRKDHQRHVQQLAHKYRPHLDEDADDIGKRLQPRAGIKRIRQQPFYQRQGLEGIEDAVGFIGVF